MLTTVMSRIDMMAPSTTTPATLRTPLSNLSLVDCGAVVVVMDKLLPAGVGPILPAGSQGSSTGFRIAWSDGWPVVSTGVRADQQVGAAGPQHREQQAAEGVGGVVLAPVEARQRHQGRDHDERDQDQPPPARSGVPDHQDRDREIDAQGGGDVSGRVRV